MAGKYTLEDPRYSPDFLEAINGFGDIGHIPAYWDNATDELYAHVVRFHPTLGTTYHWVSHEKLYDENFVGRLDVLAPKNAAKKAFRHAYELNKKSWELYE
jgi:hypothetical protein